MSLIKFIFQIFFVSVVSVFMYELYWIKGIGKCVKFIRGEAQPFFYVLFRLNDYSSTSHEAKLDFCRFFGESSTWRQHGIHAVVRVQPIADTPKEIGAHIGKRVLSGYIRQFLAAFGLGPFTVFTTMNIGLFSIQPFFVAHLKTARINTRTFPDSINEYWKIQYKLPPKTKRFCPLVLK